MTVSDHAWSSFKRTVKPYTPESIRVVFRTLRKLFNISPYPDVDLDLSKALPVLVYQMGKVGSRSVIESLNQVAGIHAMHVHRIGSDIHPNLNKRITARTEAVKIITMVRDPISRNISSYFHLLDNHFKTRDAHSKYSVDEIKSHFFDYIETDVEDAIGWFDTEFKHMTGVDVYRHDFPLERKYSRIKADPFDILILRVDLEDPIKVEIISDFLDIDELSLVRSNLGKARNNGVEYKRFATSIKLPEQYLTKNLDSKFTRHFFGSEEIELMYHRWSQDKPARQ